MEVSSNDDRRKAHNAAVRKMLFNPSLNTSPASLPMQPLDHDELWSR